jgi:ligand-binding sensor domain-containing protein
MRLKLSNKIIGIGLIIVLTILGFEIFRVYKSAQTSLSEERARLLEKTSVAFVKTRLTPYQSNDVRTWQNFSATRAFIKYQNSYFAATSGGLVQYSSGGEIIKHYTVLDGLPESDLTALAVWSEKLFIGTRAKGLLEFDGQTFTQYEWTDRRAQTVAALLNDDENRLLIGTFGGGLLEFGGTDFREIKAEHKQIKAVNFLSKPDGKLMVGTFDNGLWIYDKDRWAHFTTAEGLNSNRIVGITQQDKNLLIATDFGLSILEANKFRAIEILPALSSSIKFDSRIFLTRDNGEIFTFDKSLAEFTKKNNLTDARLTVAGERLFLLGTGGVFSFDDNKFEAFGDAGNKTLTDNFVSALATDRRGNLWAGTFRHGIDVLAGNGKLLTHLETESIREINYLLVNGESVSAATTQGLFQIKSDFSFTVFDKTKGAPTGAITHISDGVIATARGLVFTGEKTPRILSAVNRLPNNSVYTTLKIGEIIYAGTLSGLAQIENKKVIRLWQDSNSNLATNWVTALVSANERIFIGTYGGGIFELLPSGEIRSFADETGKFVVNPNALAADGKRLYVGTLDGAKILDLQTQKWTNVKKVLPSETVMSVAADEENVYFGTASGIAVIKKSYFENAEKEDENF